MDFPNGFCFRMPQLMQNSNVIRGSKLIIHRSSVKSAWHQESKSCSFRTNEPTKSHTSSVSRFLGAKIQFLTVAEGFFGLQSELRESFYAHKSSGVAKSTCQKILHRFQTDQSSWKTRPWVFNARRELFISPSTATSLVILTTSKLSKINN